MWRPLGGDSQFYLPQHGTLSTFQFIPASIKHIEYVNSIQQYEVVTVFNEVVTVFNEMVTVFNAHEPHPAAVALLP